MPTQLTEVQAWEEVARRFVENPPRECGLCTVVEDMYWRDERSVDGHVRTNMTTRINSYLGDDTWAYGEWDDVENWEVWVKNDEGRALAALWLMCEAAEEQGVRL